MLVSAIMPTRARPALSRVALNCFLRQTYEQKELVILDDIDAPSFPQALDLLQYRNVLYLRVPRMDLGLKRNALCEIARGEVIVHFDSDDWSDPERIADQVARLVSSGRPVTGYCSLLFWVDEASKGFQWKVSKPPAMRHADGTLETVCGASMCYWREFWKAHPYPDVQLGEDSYMEAAGQRFGGVSSEESRNLLIARVHGDNTSSSGRLGHNSWPEVPQSQFPAAFFEDIK